LLYYLPFDDELVKTLDFVCLSHEHDELKKKILSFNKEFNIISFDKINELSKEIAELNEENMFLFRKDAKKSSLYLWDLIKQANNYPAEDFRYKHLDKIFKIAHALPTSSANVEQSFSMLKLIQSSIRNRLHEETIQALMMISEEFRNVKISISDEMIDLYDQYKEELNRKKNGKPKETILVTLNKKMRV